MCASAGEDVEVFALDQRGRGRRFTYRDQWNVPAPAARFRVRRVVTGGSAARIGELERARLEGLVLDWIRARDPRIVHVLDLDGFGPGLLFALAAADLPVILTLRRVDELRRALAGPTSAFEGDGGIADALASVMRIVVRSAVDASVAEEAGASREKIRVMAGGENGEQSVLKSYSSLYRMLAPVAR